MKEFKNADELQKKLAKLVAQDWKEVVSRPETSPVLPGTMWLIQKLNLGGRN